MISWALDYLVVVCFILGILSINVHYLWVSHLKHSFGLINLFNLSKLFPDHATCCFVHCSHLSENKNWLITWHSIVETLSMFYVKCVIFCSWSWLIEMEGLMMMMMMNMSPFVKAKPKPSLPFLILNNPIRSRPIPLLGLFHLMACSRSHPSSLP